MESKKSFVIYSEENVFLGGDIKAGCLHLESCVYGDDYDSEKHYSFSKEDTERLFGILAFDDFVKACREGHLVWLEEFLEENGIRPRTVCI